MPFMKRLSSNEHEAPVASRIVCGMKVGIQGRTVLSLNVYRKATGVLVPAYYTHTCRCIAHNTSKPDGADVPEVGFGKACSLEMDLLMFSVFSRP